MTHFQVTQAKELGEAAKKLHEREIVSRRQSERAGIGRIHDLDNMLDLIAEMFDEMDAVFRVLSLRLIEDFMNDGDSPILISSLSKLQTELETNKEALRKIESFISQP